MHRALQSIQKQSSTNFECILVNNNSTDQSIAIAELFTTADRRFILINEPRQGVMHASNAGCNNAKGKYIARMDADDWAFPNRLEKQYKFLEQNKDYGAVGGLVAYVAHKKQTEGFKRYVNWVNSISNYHEILKNRFVESPIVNPTAMWRSKIGNKLGLYRDGDFPEDYEMWLRWLDAGVKIGKVKEPILKWFDSDLRLTRTHDIYSDEAFYRIKSKYLFKCLVRHNPHFPNVVVWGASRISRQRVKFLEEQGITIKYYVDIKQGRQLDKKVKLYTSLNSPDSVFVLCYLKNDIARARTKDYLISKGFIEGKSFLMVS